MISLILAGLLKAGLPLLASAVMSKGAEVIQDKLGVDIKDALGTEEGRLKLKELELQHDEFLRTAASQAEERDLKGFELEVNDRVSARSANAQIATSEAAPWYDKVLLPGMAILTTLGFFGCLGALFYLSAKNIKLDDNSRDILIYAFGALTGGWMTVMNFLFGTSKGGRENQIALAKIAGTR